MRYDTKETITDEQTTKPVKCRRCGTTSNEALKVVISWYDWDDPDPDAQGQKKYAHEWICTFLNGCVERILTGSNVEMLKWVATDPEIQKFTGPKWSERAREGLREIGEIQVGLDHQAELEARERGWGAIVQRG